MAFLFKESLVNISFVISKLSHGAGLLLSLTILLGVCKLRTKFISPICCEIAIEFKACTMLESLLHCFDLISYLKGYISDAERLREREGCTVETCLESLCGYLYLRFFFFADPSREPQQHDVPCSQWSIRWNILQNYCLLSLASYNVSYWKGFLYHWAWVCCPSVQNTARKVREDRVLRLIFYYEKFGVVTRVTKK